MQLVLNGLSSAILAQFTIKMCVAAQNCEVTKNPYFGVQGRSRSLILMPIKRPY